ncbi:phenolic acid decarboxylase padC [Burkholderia sp. MSMB1078WGS]|uniref:phenolic acid decarboxylase n=1 Tax=Burkholderia sp. MSMB1078WGS TaxID=1637900 RepID=UPI0007545452|nr:phenolic acid decarboxylase [Burkholderia sp. MSMB1078WGS]KVT12701.1 phenolic acid decarboxylase padC [Burkholderia sp. MSMB1078WGS]
MTSPSDNDKIQNLSPFVGLHFIYTYANGWKYEWYARNELTCDYRIHHGLVGGRWVTHQPMTLTKLASGTYKADWHEPTGTCVSLYFDIERRLIHGTIFFPQWIGGEGQSPEKTICFQNEFIEDMHRFRDDGPAYPYVIVSEFANITWMKQCGPDNDDVIAKAPGQLPSDYLDRTN